jgi:serine protease inhibitor
MPAQRATPAGSSRALGVDDSVPEELDQQDLKLLHAGNTDDVVRVITAVSLWARRSLREAEFTPISDNGIWIGRVKQRATVALDEEGTEAAAAMSIQFIRGYVPADFAFIVDRPFYWDICDKESNLLLLVGFVANPTDR